MQYYTVLYRTRCYTILNHSLPYRSGPAETLTLVLTNQCHEDTEHKRKQSALEEADTKHWQVFFCFIHNSNP